MAGHPGRLITPDRSDAFDLTALPRPSGKRLAVRVTRDAERQLRSGHPWLYDGSITSVSHPGAPGDLAVVFDHDRDFLAIGLWDPHSPIRLKVLHRGKPRTIDGAFLADRVAAAAARREDLEADGTSAYRVVAGENDGLPGLIVDRYGDVAVLKLYSAAWLAHLGDVVSAVTAAFEPSTVVARFSRLVAGAAAEVDLIDGAALVGRAPSEPVLFTENRLTFEADVIHGQKTGHFLDQRDNRQRVRELAEGRRVLDVFACTGGFSVYAAAGGARRVDSVDIARPALDTAVRNMAHNRDVPAVAACDHRVMAGDAFEVMAELCAAGDRYDIVVIDPPSFAKRASEVDAALRAYTRLTHLGLGVLSPGGLLVQASCSSRVSEEAFLGAVTDAARVAGRPLDILATTGHALDHPVTFPEGAYLNAIFATT